MKTFLRVFWLACIVAAFALGWWPQRARRLVLQQELAFSREQLATAQAEVHLYRLQGQLLALLDLVQTGNFAGAQSVSSAFFDAVRSQSLLGGPAALALQMILAQRDAVTAAIARKDPSVANTLRTMRAPLMRLQPLLPAVPKSSSSKASSSAPPPPPPPSAPSASPPAASPPP